MKSGPVIRAGQNSWGMVSCIISTLRWAVHTVLWIGFCHTGPISLCVDLFVFICVFCVFFFHTAYFSHYCEHRGMDMMGLRIP